MKKTASSFVYSTLLLLVITSFSSCKKDELSSKELLVYLKGDYSLVDNRIMIPFVHSPVSITGNPVAKFPFYATREVAADINVTVAVDMSLVDLYNQQYDTNYLPLPQANYKIVGALTHTIGAGKLLSDSVQVEILNPGTLTDAKGYLLPITITGIESKDKGVVVSTNKRTVYLHVTYEFNNVEPTQVSMAGTPMSRTGWSVTVSNTTSGALGPAMLDGSNSTAWRSSNSGSAAKWAILNMGSQQTIKAFQLVPNYVNTSENATQITVSSSNDNTNWTLQGIWKGTGPASTSNATTPDIKGVNFKSPVQAQYFRFEINTWVSGNRVGIGELNAIQ